jgi:hypothetical protein
MPVRENSSGAFPALRCAAIGPLNDVPTSGRPNDQAAEVDVPGDKTVLVSAEPKGGSSEPTSSPVLAAQMT